MLDGGGVSHRGGLYDAILVKENHAALAGGIVPAARAALAAAGGAAFVELEVESLDELDQALAEGVDRILLDNMGPDQLREAVARCAGRATLEASGGITLDTIRAVAETGVDYISVGGADALGAGAGPQPAAGPGGRRTANGSVTSTEREPKR